MSAAGEELRPVPASIQQSYHVEALQLALCGDSTQIAEALIRAYAVGHAVGRESMELQLWVQRMRARVPA